MADMKQAVQLVLKPAALTATAYAESGAIMHMVSIHTHGCEETPKQGLTCAATIGLAVCQDGVRQYSTDSFAKQRNLVPHRISEISHKEIFAVRRTESGCAFIGSAGGDASGVELPHGVGR